MSVKDITLAYGNLFFDSRDGKGGGRPDNAMAGGREVDKIGEALAAAAELLAAQLK